MKKSDTRGEEGHPAPIDLASYLQGPTRDTRKLYASLRLLGYQYGSGLQVIKHVWSHQNKWIFELRIPAGEQSERTSRLNPALVDGIFQAVLVKEYLLDARPPRDNTLHVPYVIKSFMTYSTIQDRCFVVLNEEDIERKSGDICVQLRAYNESGECVLHIEDMIFKRVSREFLNKPENRVPPASNDGTSGARGNSLFYYRPLWIERELSGLQRDVSRRHAIVFAGEDREAAGLNADIGQRYSKTFYIRRKTSASGPYDSLVIDADKKRDYEEVVRTIHSQGDAQCEGYDLFYLWAYHPDEQAPSGEELLSKEQEGEVRAFFLLIQALGNLSLKKKIHIIVALWKSQVVTSRDRGEGFRQGGLFGLSKTVMLEYPGITIKIADFSEKKQLAGLVEENLSSDSIERAAYRGQTRSVFSLEPMPAPPSGNLLLREKGVYLVLGGLGGIGFKIAELMTRGVRVRLVLLGRSELTPEKQQQLMLLKKSGSEVMYIQADAADPVAMKAALKKIKRRYLKLNGVIQTSGIVEDRLLVNKDWASFQRVLSPKVKGTWTINELTRKEPLDFFVTFSSIVSVMGNRGQADYAAANSFLDSFIQYRNRNNYPGRSLSINWSLWSDGGMGKDRSTVESFSKKAGVIDSSAGLQAFSDLLGSSSGQVIVAGHPELFVSGLVPQKESPSRGNLARVHANAMVPELGGNLIRDALLDLLAEITQTSSSELDTNTDLRDFGLDSVALSEFADRISRQYDIVIEPTAFFEHPTIEALEQHLSAKYGVPVKTGPQDTIGLSPPPHDRAFHGSSDVRELVSERLAAVLKHESVLTGSAFGNGEQNGRSAVQDIAIIGMSGSFPGAGSIKEFWKGLLEKKDAITEIPKDRWDWRAQPGSAQAGVDGTNTKWGGFLEDVRAFDASFFQISPREAERMDPQQRLLLQEVWRCIEDAGHMPSSLAGTNTGIFIGVCNNDYSDLLLESGIHQDAYVSTGSYFSIIPNRISFLLDLHGPSVAIDTACSGSLIAIHQAVLALHNNDCDLAFAGGVNVCLTPRRYSSFGHAGMLSQDGRCKTFDKSANGYVRGEGVGAILLKPLGRAQADGDHIYAVIKGSEVNHGGRANSLTAPNPNAQSELLVRAYERARIDPWTVGYIEAHGTGTSLGDPVEINGLKNAFAELYRRKGRPLPSEPRCGLGSVKTNIGHLESAAGIAGVIKTVLAMQHETIPASIHFQAINPYIHLQGSPFFIVTETMPWKSLKDEDGRQLPRRAGVSSFGFGGANAHVVLEEYIPQVPVLPVRSVTARSKSIIVLSAKNEERLKVQARQLLTAVRERQFTDTDLADIAFTLQVGREAMEERIALIVESLKDLEVKLNKYVEGETGIKDLVRGQVKRNRETGSVFTTDEELQKAIDVWIAEGKYAKLLYWWVTLPTFDWNKLYGENKPRRISLPTYPFARERYWVPEESAGDKLSSGAGRGQHLHPLLQQNSSDLSEQRFSSTFTGEEFFLSDHVVKGNRVLPGVAYLEMARAAVDLAAVPQDGQAGMRLKNIVWARPVVQNGRPVQVHIGLYPGAGGEIAYEIYSGSAENGFEPTLHSQGTAVLSASSVVPALDLPRIQAQCAKTMISSGQCYEAFKVMGLEYGPGHRGLEQVYVGEGQVLAKLAMPLSVIDTKDQFVLHPSIMDSALQASIGFLPGADDPDFSGGAMPLDPALPFALQELEVLGGCMPTMWAFIQHSKGGKAGDNAQKLDIDICDEQGAVCVRMKGFSSRAMEAEAGPFGTLLLEPVWNERPLAPDAPVPDYAAHLVMLCEPGDISPEDIEARIRGVRCLVLQSDQSGIGERYQAYAARVFEEIQAVLNDKTTGNVLFQVVVPAEGEQRLFSGLSGLLKTARIENPKLIGQLIEVEKGEDAFGTGEKLTENSRSPGDSRIRYQGGKRSVVGWSEIEVSQKEAGIPWKDRGIYLITGGAGGLGLLFAKEITKRVKDATLILTGRSPLKETTQFQLRELEALGCRVSYKQVDVSDKKAVAELIQGILSDFGRLSGIVHGAGITRDNFIIKKTKEELQAVLLPKVNGLVNLDEASKELPLDCFIFFSSIAGGLGNMGQADYSAANAFMDAYAGYRNDLAASKQRHGRTLSINWPLWKEGGMQVDEATEKLLMQSAGTVPLRTETGIRALYQAMDTGRSQVMVLEGRPDKIRQKLLSRMISSTPQTSRTSAASGSSAGRDAAGLRDKVQAALTQMVSKILKVKIADIDVDTELNEFGFDSISLTEFGNKLNQEYKLELIPTIFFEYPTIRRFTEYLVAEHQSVLAPKFSIQTGTELSAQAREDERGPLPSIKSRRSRFASTTTLTEARPDTAVPEPIAIVGMSGKFPGAGDVDEFWNNLVDGRDCITEIPKERWDWREYYGDPKKEANKTNIKWGGFIEGIDEFDPLFFGISPREAVQMDPQQRLLMTYIWKAIEDAGYSAQSLSGTNTALFVGTMSSGYSGLISQAKAAIEGYTATGGVPSVGPNRMSYFLNIHGPSEPIETACSSSLIAIHRAIQVIQDGSCEMAIAGGVNTIINPELHISFSKAGMLSEDGRCKTFSNKANGYVRGEGVGMLFLKKLKDAERSGDHIYGVIRGTAENHGGRSNSLTAPNPQAQAELLQTAYTKAKIDPRTITYIEAHGTGTELGDPIEITGLKKAFKELYLATGDAPVASSHCGLGSVKSNIGHLELAAGIAGVIKVILQLKHKTLVKSLHCDTINPYIQLADSPFYIVQETRKWEALLDSHGKELPRRAGVSSFGFGGANAHVVIEEYVPAKQEETHATSSKQNPVIVVFSARDENRLTERVQQLLTAIRKPQFVDADLSDIAYTLQEGREELEERLAVIVSSIKELEEKLSNYLDGQEGVEDLYRGQVKRNKETIAGILSDEKFQDTLDKWIRHKIYSKLADLWVKGLIIDWNKLYVDTRHSHISLPTYPFARERYWVTTPSGKTATGGQDQFAKHPPVVPDASASPKEQKGTAEEGAKSEEFKKVYYYRSEWMPKEIEEGDAGVLENIVVFDTSEGMREALKSRRGRELGPDGRTILIKPGIEFKIIDRETYEVRADEKEDYRRLLEELKRQGVAPENIIHRWSEEDGRNKTREIQERLQRGIYSVFNLSQALMEQKDVKDVRMVYLTGINNQETQPADAAVTGFAKTIRLENPRFKYKTVELGTPGDGPATDGVEEAVKELLAGDDGETAIRYEGGKRQARRITELEKENTAGRALPLKDKGVYIITGGAGGLGLIFAEYLARKVKARLVLTGRSELVTDKKKKLEEFEALGSEVMYVMADISKKEHVQELFRRAKERFGEINGILHGAGVIRDSLILNKTKEERDAVFGPKIFGTLNLEEETREEKLDLFILFSSITAVRGNIGQSDYAAANAFMDAFAEKRTRENKGTTVSINWPLWNDGGMTLDDHAKKHLAGTTGLTPLSVQGGLEAWETAVRMGLCQVIVAAGDRTRIARFLAAEQREGPRQYPAVKIPTRPDEGNAKRALSDSGKGGFVSPGDVKDIGVLVRKIIAEITGISAEKLDPRIELWELGIDELVSMKITREIEKRLGLKIFVSDIQEHNTVQMLSNHIDNKLKGEGGK